MNSAKRYVSLLKPSNQNSPDLPAAKKSRQAYSSRDSSPLACSETPIISTSSVGSELNEVSACLSHGRLKYYALKSTTFKQYSRNKIRIILDVKHPSLNPSTHPPCSFFGLYTSHSGSSCASFLQQSLHRYIFNDPNFPSRPKEALRCGFLQADTDFILKASENLDFSGAFAIVALIIGRKCYIAHTGNCRAFASISNGLRTSMISLSHTPDSLLEAQRVSENQGSIYRDFIIDSNGIKKSTGPFKVSPGKKKFTRSFGDIDAKVEEFGGNKGVIVPEPSVKIFRVNESCDFLALTSENLCEAVGAEDFVKEFWSEGPVHESFQSQISHKLTRIFDKATATHTTGNFSSILIGFKLLQPSVYIN